MSLGQRRTCLSMRDLLYQMRSAQYLESHDQIHNLFTLVDGGKGFCGGYTEPDVDIFWRAEERFCVWVQPYYVDILQWCR